MGGFLTFTFLSMALLAKATQTLPIGTAYPVWTGIGAVGTVMVGILCFHEPATAWRLFFLTSGMRHPKNLLRSKRGLMARCSSVRNRVLVSLC